MSAPTTPTSGGRSRQIVRSNILPAVSPKPNGKAEDPLGIVDSGDNLGPIPPREWLLGNAICRKFISMLTGSGGVGKTALAYVRYLALATGHPLSKEHVHRRCRVLIVSLEDDMDELRRRIEAARNRYGISYAEIVGWLLLCAPGLGGGKLVTLKSSGMPEPSNLATAIEAAIERHRPDVVSIDPMIKAHGVDENAAGQIDIVMQTLSDIAVKHNVAIDLIHHHRKGAADPGNADMARGGSGIVNAARLASTLSVMSPQEAQTFEIDDSDRRAFVRLDNAKLNIARPSDTTWFRLVGVKLGNGTDEYPNGDEVQTIEPWSPPAPWEGISNDLANAILTDIDAGLPDGNRYTHAAKAGDREAWRVIVKHAPKRTEKQARAIIKTWIKNDVLIVEPYDNPTTRKTVNGLKVNSIKRPS